MPKIPTRQGGEFQLRQGADLFQGQGWRGVNTESNPGSLSPNELQAALNVRLRGGDIWTRPGSQFIVDLKPFGPPLFGNQSPVMWLENAPVDNPRVKLWFVCFGCFGVALGTGASLLNIDPMAVPVVQSYSRFFSSANKQAPIGGYGDQLLIGDKTALREILLLSNPPTIPSQDFAPTPPTSPLATWPGFTATCCKAFDGKFFIGLSNDTTPAASKIVAWNGLSLSDDLTGTRPPRAFGLWNDKLVCGFDDAAGHVRVRSMGDSPGSWATVALVGFVCATQGNAMQGERQYLYIASGTDKIFRFDGTNLTLIRTIVGAAVDGSGVTSLALVDGLLHYGWNTPAAAYASRIGRHDPDATGNEWVDTYKNITSQAGMTSFSQLSSMAAYRQQLYFGGKNAWVGATSPGDIPGTAVLVHSPAPTGPGFQVVQLLRFPSAGLG